MKYQSHPPFSHDSADGVGILLVNLGTPAAPTRSAVRRYLKEFLWDPRVVEGARVPWWVVLNLIILNTRPARSARAYARVWTEDGSPLLEISRAQQEKFAQSIRTQGRKNVHIALAMRYGRPSVQEGLQELRVAGVRRLLILPLYPQYSATTTASVFDAVADELKSWRWIPELRFVTAYHDHPAYIASLEGSVREFQQQHGLPEVLLISFHGIPRDYFEQGDPYYCHCQKTARLLAQALELPADKYRVCFQSRLGPRQWLQPYTDQTLTELAAGGAGKVQVICPGFSADCLETLEEVAIENRDIFLAAGGAEYRYIPCLNDRNDHISALTDIAGLHLQGWGASEEAGAEMSRRARALGADR